MSLKQITEIIHNRRSIFPATYTGEIIDNEIIDEILNNANQAPSHRHTEPWRFHVITGDKRKALADFFQKTYKTNTPKDVYKELKYKKLGKNPLNSSHIICIGMQRDPNESLPEWEEIAAVACAIQNIYLSVNAAGYGGYWSTPTLMMKHIHQFIELNEGERCLGFFYIGVPQERVRPIVQKGDVREKTKWYL